MYAYIYTYIHVIYISIILKLIFMQTEITIDVAGFRQVLGQLKGAISPKTPLPILQCVKLSFDRQAEVFRLTGSNSELWLTCDCTTTTTDADGNADTQPCVHLLKEDPKEPFCDVCLPYAPLREAFSLLPASRRCTVILKQKADARTCTIDYQDGQMDVPFYDALEFPDAPAVVTPEQPREGTDAVCRFQIGAQDLLGPVIQSRACVAADELRPVMGAVCLDCSIDKVVVAASDGHRLYKQVIECPGYLKHVGFSADSSAKLLVPKSAMASLIAAFSGSGTLTVTADSRRLMMQMGGATLNMAQIEGNYPNYDSVIPKDNPYKVQLSRESLKMALRRVQLSSDGTTNLAIMRSDGTAFIVEASNVADGRQGSERVAVQETDAFLPQGFKIGMKLSNVIELLDMLDEDSVCLYFSDPSHPILLRNESQNLQGKTLLVMPMLIN